MATGMLFAVTNTLFAALQNKELRELCSSFGYESQLEQLQCTVITIKAALLDAEYKHHDLPHEGLDWVDKLKDAVYDADDLFDEFNTIAQQLERMPGGKISKKVCRYFSNKNELVYAFNTSREIKRLREKLDIIARDSKETCCHVYNKSIIGREAEKEAIIGMLLSDKEYHGNVCFVTIVGMGGLGKTALAQLVFNDDRVKEAFGEWMRWVCVTDEFGMEEILGKLVRKNDKLEVMQREVRNMIEGRKYLLALDDVCCHKSQKWVELRDFLSLGEKGSRVLVISRSMEVANVVGDNLIHKLEGLSEENSWNLFKRMAFKQEKKEQDVDLVDIGKEITKKCANVPLSILVIGSLLCGQDKNTWLSLECIDFAKMRQGDENGVKSILMFSYYQLTPELKSCFSFCSLFPKDYLIKKDVLIHLWLAQGYLFPSREGQSMEDVGEEYFSILLHRSFFQDIEQDEYGEVHSFKIHDLIHDLAVEVAGKESLMLVASSTNHFRRTIRHLSTTNYSHFNNLFSPTDCSGVTLRTFFLLYDLQKTSCDVATMISSCRRLRILDLHNLAIGSLPNTLGKLLHLRYLDLSGNDNMVMLPASITKLHNLHILKLRNCRNLKQLPEDISRLVNLRMLDLDECGSLTHMPSGMDNLKRLRTLTMFVVGEDDDSISNRVKQGELIDLKDLVNLKGYLCIKLLDFSSNYIQIVTEDYILKDAHLKTLEIVCEVWSVQSDVHETLLQGLYPNHDLSKIVMKGYQGTKLPSWVSFLSLLVSIELSDFHELQHLPSLCQLCHLKNLQLRNMPCIEYIENYAPSAVPTTLFFPSLEKLLLLEMSQLKGWWRDLRWIHDNGGKEQALTLKSFPRLRDLSIGYCESMTYFPPCPHVKKLELWAVNETLTFCMKEGLHQSASSCLEELNIDNPRIFNALFDEFALGAVHVHIEDFDQVESLWDVRKGFKGCKTSIRHLKLESCREVTTLSGSGIEHLYNLQSLSVARCDHLDLESMPWCDSFDYGGVPCITLNSLHSLTLVELPKLVNLPWRFQYLTSLQSLRIGSCDNLEALGECVGSLTSLKLIHIVDCHKLKLLPEAIRHLTSLTTVQIEACNELEKRCQQPDGEDWPKIQHIRRVWISRRRRSYF